MMATYREALQMFDDELKRLKLLDAVAAQRLATAVRILIATAPKQGALDFDTHAENLERVTGALEPHILAFFAQTTGTFHMEDLRQFIARRKVSCAPGSPERILRDLRKRGELNYVLESRRQSLYRVCR